MVRWDVGWAGERYHFYGSFWENWGGAPFIGKGVVVKDRNCGGLGGWLRPVVGRFDARGGVDEGASTRKSE